MLRSYLHLPHRGVCETRSIFFDRVILWTQKNIHRDISHRVKTPNTVWCRRYVIQVYDHDDTLLCWWRFRNVFPYVPPVVVLNQYAVYRIALLDPSNCFESLTPSQSHERLANIHYITQIENKVLW